jgi:Ca2+-binding EF-hand superfamily protein
MDKDRSGQLSMQEMYRAMKDYRVSNDEREVRAIFNFFDIDLNGQVSYDEFLRAIVGEMNDDRKEVCIRAFNVID